MVNKMEKKSKTLSIAKKIGLSSSLLAGFFAVSGTLNQVQAQNGQGAIDEVRALQAQYHSVESQAQTEDIHNDETDAQVEQENNEASVDQELSAIKQQLIQVINRAGGQDLLNQLRVEELSVDELDNVFDAFITYQQNKIEETPVVEENTEETSNTQEENINSEVTEEINEETPEATEEINTYNETDAEQVEAETESESAEEVNMEDEEVSPEETDTEENKSVEASTFNSNSEEIVEEETPEDVEDSEEAISSDEEDSAEAEENQESEEDSTEEDDNNEDLNETDSDDETSEDEDNLETDGDEETEDDNNEESFAEAEDSEEESLEQDEDLDEENAEEEASAEEEQEDSTEEASEEETDSEDEEVAEEVDSEDDENAEDEEKVEEVNSEDLEDEEIAENEGKVEEVETITHVVSSGDTLNKLSEQYDSPVDSIVERNDIENANLLSVGRSLSIDVPQATAEDIRKRQEAVSEDIEQVNSSNGFINEIGPYASEVADRYNLYASVMISQAALESGYGGSTLSKAPNHNLFGIKGSYNGQSVAMRTREYSNTSGWITVTDYFKKYPSFAESFEDNARLLRNGVSWDPDFYAGTWKENTNSYRDATQWLQGRYATDPNYASKLNNIVVQYDLTRYDNGPVTNGSYIPDIGDGNSGRPSGEEDNTNENTEATTHNVVYGDTLTGISNTYGPPINAIKSANNLSSDMIYVGQVLVIPGQGNGSSSDGPSDSNEGSSSVTYTVKAGDNLTQIANNFDTSVNTLQNVNNIPGSGDLIHVGQVLTIPGQGSGSSSNSGSGSSSESESPSQTSNGTYTVQAGDNLTQIANNFGTSLNALKDANNISGSGDLIYVGQTLTIPGQSSGSSSNSGSGSSSNSSDSGNSNSSSQTSNDTYTVRSGDNLTQIANNFGTSLNALKDANNISGSGDLIYVGQTLTIPGQDSGSSSNSGSGSSSESESSSQTSNGTYTVRSGDNLTQIANNFGTTLNALKDANNISGSGDLIYVGQTLTIPGQSSGSSSNSGSGSSSNSSDSGNSNSSSQTSNGTYTVRSGDNLTQIANNFGTSLNALKSANNISGSGDLIYVGQTLTIPGQSSGSSSNSGSGSSSDSDNSNNSSQTLNGSYTVQAGDTLSHIARANNTTVRALQQANNLSGDIIYVGQTLNLPGSSSNNNPGTPSSSNSSSQPSATGTYTVRAGDTLSRIASNHGTTVSNLVSLNNLSSDLIFVGQTLKVDGSSSSSNNDSSSGSSNNQNNDQIPLSYTVQAGDTLSGIARRYNVSQNQLAQWNNISNSDMIYVGQTLNLRLNSGTPSSGSGSSGGSSQSSGGSVSWSTLRSIGESQLGTPYVWAGTSPSGFDCSGFTQWVFAQAGVSIPRNTNQQYRAATKVSNPVPGDLVFFGSGPSNITHVGIYAGNGRFLGAQVSTGVAYANVHSSYWGPRLVGYGRI